MLENSEILHMFTSAKAQTNYPAFHSTVIFNQTRAVALDTQDTMKSQRSRKQKKSKFRAASSTKEMLPAEAHLGEQVRHHRVVEDGTF